MPPVTALKGDAFDYVRSQEAEIAGQSHALDLAAVGPRSDRIIAVSLPLGKSACLNNNTFIIYTIILFDLLQC